jgi:hypothetical protein
MIGYISSPAIDVDGDGNKKSNILPYFQACDLDDFNDTKAENIYTYTM